MVEQERTKPRLLVIKYPALNNYLASEFTGYGSHASPRRTSGHLREVIDLMTKLPHQTLLAIPELHNVDGVDRFAIESSRSRLLLMDDRVGEEARVVYGAMALRRARITDKRIFSASEIELDLLLSH